MFRSRVHQFIVTTAVGTIVIFALALSLTYCPPGDYRYYVEGSGSFDECTVRIGQPIADRDDFVVLGAVYAVGIGFVANGVLVHPRWFLTINITNQTRIEYHVVVGASTLIDAQKRSVDRVEHHDRFMMLHLTYAAVDTPSKTDLLVRLVDDDDDNNEWLKKTVTERSRWVSATFLAYSFGSMAIHPNTDGSIELRQLRFGDATPVFKTIRIDRRCDDYCVIDIGPDCYIICEENMGAPIISAANTRHVMEKHTIAYTLHGLIRTEQKKTTNNSSVADCLSDGSASNVMQRIDAKWIRQIIAANKQ